MDIAQRTAAYRAIEDLRGRPLIVYATSTRANAENLMSGDAVRQFIDQIDRIAESSRVDVLIHSHGGDPLAAWKLMSLLRERFDHVSVLVPYAAFSAATVFALGADEIVMHPHASLGPIDPQIQIRFADGSERRFAFEDVGAFLRFISGEAALTEQPHVAAVLEHLLRAVDPLNIGAAKRASELSTEIGERLLLTHMKSDGEQSQARAIAESLNKKFFAHGDAVSRSRAKALNMKVSERDPDLERLLWTAFEGIESYMQLRDPWNALHHFQANGGAATLSQPSPLVLPSNTPPQIAQDLWNQVANQAVTNLTVPALQVPFTIVNSLVESCREASEHTTIGSVSAVRLIGGEVHLSALERSRGWRTVPLNGASVTTGAAQTPNP